MSNNCKLSFLLIHGFTGTHYEMEPLEKFLTNKGFKVINITLPGHETTLEDMGDTTWKMWVDYAQKELDKLKKQTEKTIVVGLSLGGMIALYLGSKNDTLTGIVTMNAPYKVPDWRMYLFKIIPFIEKIYPLHKSKEEGWEDLEALKRHRCYDYLPTKSIRQLYQLMKKVKQNIPKIRVPILILQARRDKSIPNSHSKWIYRKVLSLDKQLEWIEKGGHVIPEDAGKNQAFQIIHRWVKKRVD